MNISYLLQSWEEENWALLYRVYSRSRRRLRKLIKLKTLLLNLALFLAYVLVSRGWLLLKAIAQPGPRELSFHVSPELPSISETEQNWRLRESVGPNVFLR